MSEQSNTFSMAVVLMAVLVLGFLAVNAFRWYCDDIFITLRYVEQFIEGNGFVYNAGERVEGYTHFLWLLIITLLRRLGIDPAGAVMNLGVVSFLGTLTVFVFISRKLSRERLVLIVPMTSLALIANHECRIWASGGLETAFFTFLLSLAFFVYFFTSLRRGSRLWIAGLLLTLASMTRPDALLIYGAAGFLVICGAVRSGRGAVGATIGAAIFSAPAAIVYGPYALWKISYYGSFFPNSYYAKSANLSYYSQGFYYLWLYFRAHPTSALFLLSASIVLPFYAGRHREIGGVIDEDRPMESAGRAEAVRDSPDSAGCAADVEIRPDGAEFAGSDGGVAPFAAVEHRRESSEGAALTALVVITAYLVFFIARVGGGFMYARFIVPMLPFVYFLIEWSMRRFVPRSPRMLCAILLLVPLFVAGVEGMLRNDLLIDDGNGRGDVRIHRGILDERQYYIEGGIITRDRWLGERLRGYFTDIDATVLLRGQACFGYYAKFRRCVDNAGLTNAEIARMPLEKRGRIGHEKSPSRRWLVEHGVDLVFACPPYLERDYRMVYFQIGDVALRAELITYDAGLMKLLRDRMKSEIMFEPFEQVLDEYIRHDMRGRSRAELERDYEEFREFYFDHNDDRERERHFRDALSAGGDE